MSHTFRHASQDDDRHIVAWTFQRPAAAERLARGETVEADGRHAWH